MEDAAELIFAAFLEKQKIVTVDSTDISFERLSSPEP